ncbi:hypothetical protein MNBD_NITROSPINAE02-508 [hydrothermal vent metagenome]|uniref:Uncharacterized protein n=1 Tax=hydrothermal vent metagenome TaxID=652676 RepID=A0A3B1CEN8_9ZZZZ
MNYSIQDIENKIIATLSPLATDSGGDVNTLDTYRGQFGDGALMEEDALLLCPAILVRYIESTYDPDGGSSYETRIRFALYHASSNLAPEERKQDVLNLLYKSKALLNLNDLGLDIAPLTIERETMVTSSKNVTVYSAFYSTGFQEDVTKYSA